MYFSTHPWFHTNSPTLVPSCRQLNGNYHGHSSLSQKYPSTIPGAPIHHNGSHFLPSSHVGWCRLIKHLIKFHHTTLPTTDHLGSIEQLSEYPSQCTQTVA